MPNKNDKFPKILAECMDENGIIDESALKTAAAAGLAGALALGGGALAHRAITNKMAQNTAPISKPAQFNTHGAVQQVKEGMNLSQVKELLGQPWGKRVVDGAVIVYWEGEDGSGLDGIIEVIFDGGVVVRPPHIMH